MTTYRLLLLPGDGIGVETVAEVERCVRSALERTPLPSKHSQDLDG